MEAWIALVGTLLGGPVVIKFIDWLLGRGKVKDDAASQIREELRKDIESAKKEAASCREEMRTVERELDKWKERYFTELESTWKPAPGGGE